MKLISLVFLGLFSYTSHGFPAAPFDGLKSKVVPPIHETSGAYDFEGIVKLHNCSGSVIRFIGQPMEANAIVLTNGHCLSGPFIGPGEIVSNQSSRRSMRVADKNKRFHYVRAQKLIYATMTGTDAALYQLEETYNDLKAKGISAFELSDARPAVDTDINIVSGYWERGYSCHIDGFAYELLEGDWTFTDSIRYSDSGCETIGGTSGSPIIEKDTRTVIGVNNTANESGARCTINNPCESDEQGEIVVREGTAYGQQTYVFYSCLDSEFNIDLTIEGCELTK